MDRNLARQLKLAEFPIGAYRAGHKFFLNEDDLSWSEQARRHGISINLLDLENRLQTLRNGYYCPSLSDLIEACGHHFGSLYPIKDIWTAESSDGKQVAVGHASDEAVARLWLALNNLRRSQEAQLPIARQQTQL